MRDLFFRTDDPWIAQDCRERLKNATAAAVLFCAVAGGMLSLFIGLFRLG